MIRKILISICFLQIFNAFAQLPDVAIYHNGNLIFSDSSDNNLRCVTQPLGEIKEGDTLHFKFWTKSDYKPRSSLIGIDQSNGLATNLLFQCVSCENVSFDLIVNEKFLQSTHLFTLEYHKRDLIIKWNFVVLDPLH